MQKTLFGMKLNMLLVGLALNFVGNYGGYAVWDTFFGTNPCIDTKTPTTIENFAFMFLAAAIFCGFIIGLITKENGARYGLAANSIPIILLETAYLFANPHSVPGISKRIILWVIALFISAIAGYLGEKVSTRQS